MADNMDLEKGGVKFDTGKVRLDLVPGEFIFAVAAVLTYGAIKYDDWNWAKGMRKGRIMAALGRHWIAYMVGEELDDESGLPHLWHIATCACMLMSAELRGVAEEDRQKAVEAYNKAKEIFAGMKDPAGTAKNEGHSVVETVSPELEEKVRNEDVPPIVNFIEADRPFYGLSADEVDILKQIRKDGDVDNINNFKVHVRERLQQLGLVEKTHSRGYSLTREGDATLDMILNAQRVIRGI